MTLHGTVAFAAGPFYRDLREAHISTFAQKSLLSAGVILGARHQVQTRIFTLHATSL